MTSAATDEIPVVAPHTASPVRREADSCDGLRQLGEQHGGSGCRNGYSEAGHRWVISPVRPGQQGGRLGDGGRSQEEADGHDADPGQRLR